MASDKKISEALKLYRAACQGDATARFKLLALYGIRVTG